MNQSQRLPGALIEEHFGFSNVHVVPHPSGQAVDIMFDVGAPEQPLVRKKASLSPDMARQVGRALETAAADLAGGIQVAGAEQMAALTKARAAEQALRNGNG